MPIDVAMSKKSTNININEKPCFDGYFSVLARDGILSSDFHNQIKFMRENKYDVGSCSPIANIYYGHYAETTLSGFLLRAD